MINAANVIGLNPKDCQNSAEEARVVAEINARRTIEAAHAVHREGV